MKNIYDIFYSPTNIKYYLTAMVLVTLRCLKCCRASLVPFVYNRKDRANVVVTTHGFVLLENDVNGLHTEVLYTCINSS